ncbi:MAG TPA: DUF6498-containing protein [Opitutaceae bacterium]|jgi:hypothetical protein|nr:DUF6498-containing protein [Opitutaceae bacterium]
MNGDNTRAPSQPWWTEAWPDALAFALGLGLAWWNAWKTTDLVWSLWLSSLCVGYAIIVVTIFRPVVQIIRGAAAQPALVRASPWASILGGAAILVGALFMLAFFTVHFGGFHFVHSVLLDSFFPVTGQPVHGFHMGPVYGEVFRRYWPFVIVAALAERAAFRAPPEGPPDTAVTAEAIARRKALATDSGLMAPYKNVMRMHVLIFFFAFAHFAHFENFAVYTVVYFAYFFPWRLLQRTKTPVARAA